MVMVQVAARSAAEAGGRWSARVATFAGNDSNIIYHVFAS
jgi:hypothetical protein